MVGMFSNLFINMSQCHCGWPYNASVVLVWKQETRSSIVYLLTNLEGLVKQLSSNILNLKAYLTALGNSLCTMTLGTKPKLFTQVKQAI